ncbi:MAG: S41 family peptidase [Phycisphaeraceae bacterium]|nr:MAG: S41 family peptidase [Phycisphaeraceae bacterium]
MLKGPGKIALVILAAAAASLAVLVPVLAPPARADAEPTSAYAWFDPIIDVQHLVATRYVTDPDMQQLQEAAIRGMLEALGDRYTEYVSPEELAEFNKALQGRYVGIGASVRIDEGWLTIVSPLEDSPAYRAGIMAGDRIIAVDGVSTLGLEIQESIDMLTGEPGQTVVVTVERESDRFDVPIVRRQIVTRTVAGFERMNGDGWNFIIDPESGIGYIRVSQFTGATLDEFESALRGLLDAGLEGLVLDLRFNPGGVLPAATQMADMFLEKGLIVSTRGRSHEEDSVHAVAEGTLPDFPMVVMINRQSASASEIVAGALRDNDRAIVVGSRSFGKGSVQSVVPLPSGRGQLKLTEQHYYGPSGRNINRMDDSAEWGVDPSPGFYVQMSDAEYTEMLRIRREREVIRSNGAERRRRAEASAILDVDDVLKELKDRELTVAVNALRTRLQSGAWAPAEEQRKDAAIELAELRRMQVGRDRLLRELSRVDQRIEALAAAVPEDAIERDRLIPDSATLTGGDIEIRNAEGEVVTTLKITGENLERWLVDAPVEKKEE